MTRTAVFEGRIDRLAKARLLHIQAAAVGFDRVLAAFRDPRDAAIAARLFTAPAFVAIQHAGDPQGLGDGAERLRLTSDGTLVIIGRQPPPVADNPVCVVIAVPSDAPPAAVRRCVLQAMAATGSDPLVVTDDAFVLQGLRQAGTQGHLLLLRDLARVFDRTHAGWVHLLTPECRIGPGYRDFLKALAASAAPAHQLLSLGVDLLRGDAATDIRYRAGGPATSQCRDRFELGPAAFLTPRLAFRNLIENAHDVAALIDQFGAGGVGCGPRALTQIDNPPRSIGVCIAARIRDGRTGSGWRGIDTAQARASAQVAALLASDEPQAMLRQIMRFEVVMECAVAGLPMTAAARVISTHWQAILDQLDAGPRTPKATSIREEVEGFIFDTESVVSALRDTEDGLAFDLDRLVEDRLFAVFNPAQKLRAEITGVDDPFADILTEGTSGTYPELALRIPHCAFDPAPEKELRKLARMDDAESALLQLCAMPTPNAAGPPSVAEALRLERNGDFLDAAICYAQTFLAKMDANAIAGVAYNLALLGLTRPAQALCLSSLDPRTDPALMMDILLDVVTGPTRKGESLPGFLEQVPVSPGQREKIIHRLIDAGDAAAARKELRRLKSDHFSPSADLELRVLHAAADWGAIIRRCQRGDVPSPRCERETATAIAHLGSIAEAETYLASTSLAPLLKRSILAFLKLQFGLDRESAAAFEAVAGEEIGADIAGAKREIISEVVRRGERAEAAALALDVLATEAAARELNAFFIARYWDAAGEMDLAADFYREVIIGLAAPNWLRTLCIFMLHRCWHYRGRHEEALGLFDAFQTDNGSFGALLDEGYLQLRQTYFLLNGMRSRSSLRGPRLEIESGKVIDRAAIERIAEAVAEARRERPDSFIFVFAFQTGDTYLILHFLKQLAARHGLKPESFVAFTLKRLRPIVEMFSDRLGQIIEIEPHNSFALHQRLSQFDDDRICVAHPEFLTFRGDGTSRTPVFEADFVLQSKRALGLPVNHDGDHPPALGKHIDRQPGRSVFLCPMSNSFKLLPHGFWAALAAAAAARGYRVFINKGPEGDAGIAGAEPVDLPHAELREFLDTMDCVIGLRSGLLDVVSATSAPMIVYYPVPGQAMPWPHMWTLKTLRPAELTHELILETATFDNQRLLADTLAQLDEFARQRSAK